MKVGDWVVFDMDGDIGQIVARSEVSFKRPWVVRWSSGLVTTPTGICLKPATLIDGYFMRPAPSAEGGT